MCVTCAPQVVRACIPLLYISADTVARVLLYCLLTAWTPAVL
jgi:hypothetical protein